MDGAVSVEKPTAAGDASASRLRVLEITSYPPPRAGWGVRVSFVRADIRLRGGECEVLNIGKSRRARSPEYLDVQGGLDYLRKVLRFARRGYLIHTHINGDGSKGWWLALAAQIIGRMWGCRVVLTFHAGAQQHKFPRARSRGWSWYYKAIFGLADQVICNSDVVREGIEQYGVRSEKIHPIQAFSRQYLDYEPTLLDPELERFLEAHEPVATVYFFLRPEFHIDSMLDAVRRLAQRIPRFGVVAVGLETRTPEFGRMVEAAGIADRVFPAGDLEHDRFMTILARSHFYLRTPAKDGTCSSVLEALSLGVPVVASQNGNRPPSVVTFETDDAVSLCEAVDRCWTGYASLRKAVLRPEVPDTVSTEIELLAGGRGEKAR